ncbi:MAG: hypothetical protein ACR2IS_13105, partial [Nitrososphaeraceae archaeon]
RYYSEMSCNFFATGLMLAWPNHIFTSLLLLLRLKPPKRFIEIGIISIVLIVILSYGSNFFFQDITEDNIKQTLFEQQRQRQLDSNKAISQHIASDIDSILTKTKSRGKLWLC